MNLSNVPVKEILAIGAVMATLASFYYSTGYRLDLLEAYADDIDVNAEQVKALREQSISVQARLERIDEKLDEVKDKLDNVELMIKTKKEK
jgi:predicted ATP-grasp superfamily ATP-dependent carboligase